jgi:hypothetical protein
LFYSEVPVVPVIADRTLGSPTPLSPSSVLSATQQRRRWPPLLHHSRPAPAPAPLHTLPGSSGTDSAPPRCLLPRMPRRSAVARSRHVATPVDSNCSSSPVPLLGSVARPGVLLDFFYPLMCPHFASSASPLLSTPPDHRRALCSPSSAASCDSSCTCNARNIFC